MLICRIFYSGCRPAHILLCKSVVSHRGCVQIRTLRCHGWYIPVSTASVAHHVVKQHRAYIYIGIHCVLDASLHTGCGIGPTTTGKRCSATGRAYFALPSYTVHISRLCQLIYVVNDSLSCVIANRNYVYLVSRARVSTLQKLTRTVRNSEIR